MAGVNPISALNIAFRQSNSGTKAEIIAKKAELMKEFLALDTKKLTSSSSTDLKELRENLSEFNQAVKEGVPLKTQINDLIKTIVSLEKNNLEQTLGCQIPEYKSSKEIIQPDPGKYRLAFTPKRGLVQILPKGNKPHILQITDTKNIRAGFKLDTAYNKLLSSGGTARPATSTRRTGGAAKRNPLFEKRRELFLSSGFQEIINHDGEKTYSKENFIPGINVNVHFKSDGALIDIEVSLKLGTVLTEKNADNFWEFDLSEFTEFNLIGRDDIAENPYGDIPNRHKHASAYTNELQTNKELTIEAQGQGGYAHILLDAIILKKYLIKL